MAYINTTEYSSQLRKRSIQLEDKRILIARLSGSEQEQDLHEPVNCHGYGRIRHFQIYRYSDWSPNPLPILPAARALNYSVESEIRAQVFQNAACNWRCWYCYVDFSRLAADRRVAEYFTATELIDFYLDEEQPSRVIDLSGGQPDIVPEWVFWTMEALNERGLRDKVFLWSDDNLSNRYFWDYLSSAQRRYLAEYPMYARVACFKGYDNQSFSFNTRATPELYEQQFEIFRDLCHEGLDMYAYVTFTAPPHGDPFTSMNIFIDKLQEIHPNLPLRAVPLKIEIFTPTRNRVKSQHEEAIAFQYEVHQAWIEELKRRFSKSELETPICDIELNF